MKDSVFSDFPWPSIPRLNEIPKWDEDEFSINGKKQGSLISYENVKSNWSEKLTELHEIEAGDGQHPIDSASRNLALKSFSKITKEENKLILEVGCSSGYMLQDFQKNLPHLYLMGADYLAAPLKKLSQNLPKIPLLQFDLQNCPLPDDSVDGVVALNVLEHIERDEEALKHIYRILRPGGVAHIEVPANPNLYGIYDEYLMHHRRYTLFDIISKSRSAGFKIEFTTHLGFLIYPAFWMIKKLNRRHFSKTDEQKLEIVSKQIRQTSNSFLMKALIQLETKIGNFFQFPLGIRIVIKCQK